MTDTSSLKPIADLASGHTVRRYDQELAKLRGIILEMGERVVEQTQSAVRALVDREDSQAFRVLDREPQIDFLSLDADEEVFLVIARRQPEDDAPPPQAPVDHHNQETRPDDR